MIDVCFECLECMDNSKQYREEVSKHCIEDFVKICIMCGASDIKIEEDTITCNVCYAILCYKHKR